MQRQHLLLLLWEPSGFPCVNHKERVNLPANRPKKRPLKFFTNEPTTTETATATATSLQLIHFQLQLTTAFLGNTLVLSKLASLAFDHEHHDHDDRGSASNHVRSRPCQQKQQRSMSMLLKSWLVTPAIPEPQN